MRGYFNDDRMLDAFCLPVHKKCCTRGGEFLSCFPEFSDVCWCASECVRFVGYWLVREEGVFMGMDRMATACSTYSEGGSCGTIAGIGKGAAIWAPVDDHWICWTAHSQLYW